MQNQAIILAHRTITQAGRRQPADSRLHGELKKSGMSSPEIARQASRALFAFYRWRGWLNPDNPVVVQIQEAVRRDDQFQTQPETVTLAELREKAIPSWLEGEMEIPDEWLRSLQWPPRLWLRARHAKVETVIKQVSNCRIAWPELMPACIEYVGSEDLFQSPLFREGCFEIQDMSSQQVGLFCRPQPGETWWDVCAGEGGKTLHLSDLMENQGLIWASDRAAWRLQILKRRAARAQMFNYRAVSWEGGHKLPTKTRFDGVLVDAPCSGIGTWQRNPHARWTTSAHDVEELAQIQLQMLGHACKSLKPGGKLVYSVCTLTHRETAQVARKFEQEHPEMKPWRVAHPLKPSDAPLSMHSIWPQENGGNGMFVALWKRSE